MNANDEPAELVSIPMPMPLARHLRALTLPQRAALVVDVLRQTLVARPLDAGVRLSSDDVKPQLRGTL